MVFIMILTQMVLPPLISMFTGKEIPMFFLFKKKKAPVAKLSEAEDLSRVVDTKINEADAEIKAEEEKIRLAKERLDSVKKNQTNQSNQSNVKKEEN